LVEILAPPAERVSTFSSLKNRNYRWYWVGVLASFGAMQMQFLARGWLVYEMTSSPFALGIVSAGFGLPLVTLSLFGGVVADRLPKRRVIMLSQTIMGITTLAIGVLIWTDTIQLWHLVAGSLANGTTFVFNGPARQAFVTELVDEGEIMNAFALSSAGLNLMRILGPAAAGFLIAFIGVDGVYFITVALYFVAAFTLVMITASGRPGQPRSTSARADLMEGLVYIRHHAIIRPMLIMAFVVAIFALPAQFLMPAFAKDMLNVDELGLAWPMPMMGVGAIAGSLFIASLGNFQRKGLLLLGTSFVLGFFLTLFSLSRFFYLSLALLVGVGMGNSGFMAMNNTVLLTYADAEKRGRVSSVYLITIGFMPLGVLPIGALAEVWGVSLAVGAGAVVVAVFTLVFGTALPHIRRLV
jgi:MFS family permease